MTEDRSLAARLRDVLSDEFVLDLTGWALEEQDIDNERGRLVSRLLPLISSLLEEREREIREALEAALTALDDDRIGEAGLILSRLASSSSTAAPK